MHSNHDDLFTESTKDDHKTAEVNLLRPFYDAYSDAFNKIRHELFDEELGPVVFVIQGGRATRQNTRGVFIAERWQINDKPVHEISLTAESLSKDPHEILCTLVHEMIHWCAQRRGIKDVSGTHLHNKKFRDLAREFGYIVDKRDPKHGYSHGYADATLSDLLNACIKEFKLNRFVRGYVRKPPAANEKQRSRKVFKYRCPQCQNVARTGLSVGLICSRDQRAYEFDDEMPDKEVKKKSAEKKQRTEIIDDE